MRAAGPIKSPGGSYQGQLLVAHPSLKDPNFRRSVLFLTTHQPGHGAFGFVLNRPLGKNASELLPEHGQQPLLERVPVYLGGPVGQDQLSFANLALGAVEEGSRFQSNLSLDDVAERLHVNPAGVRAFVGYAGWAAGQLESEIEQEAWVLVKADAHEVAPGSNERLWFRVMSSLGPAYKLLAAAPDDITLN